MLTYNPNMMEYCGLVDLVQRRLERIAKYRARGFKILETYHGRLCNTVENTLILVSSMIGDSEPQTHEIRNAIRFLIVWAKEMYYNEMDTSENRGVILDVGERCPRIEIPFNFDTVINIDPKTKIETIGSVVKCSIYIHPDGPKHWYEYDTSPIVEATSLDVTNLAILNTPHRTGRAF
jgi:hypothetical protein